jgi:hypothetical protein
VLKLRDVAPSHITQGRIRLPRGCKKVNIYMSATRLGLDNGAEMERYTYLNDAIIT